jgi:RNA polymerase sigma factor (sigma-70 family)
MTASNPSQDRSLLARLVGRLGPYVQDGTLRHTRIERVVNSLTLEQADRDQLVTRLLAAVEASGLVLVDDRDTAESAGGAAAAEAGTPARPSLGESPGGSVPNETDDTQDEEDWREGEPDADELATTDELVRDQHLVPDDAIYLSDEIKPASSKPHGRNRDDVLYGDHAAAVEAARRFLARRRDLRHPARILLTAEQEVGLALLARPPGADPTVDLPEFYRKALPDSSEAAQAIDAMVVHNIRLVWSIAKGYPPQVDHMMDLEDLVSYGFFGLIRAVQKFDMTKGFKFSTYATWWIRQSIQRNIADFGRAIRLPVHMFEKVTRTRAAYTRLENRGVWPSVSRLASETGYSEAEIRQHLDWMRGVHSFDAAVGDEGASLKDFLVDHRGNLDAHSHIESELMREEMSAVLASLTDRERRVIEMRFGFQQDEPSTLDQIGREFNLTRERIRQIEGKTLAKLRNPNRSSSLRSYFGASDPWDKVRRSVLDPNQVVFEVGAVPPGILQTLVARACTPKTRAIQPLLSEPSGLGTSIQRYALTLSRLAQADRIYEHVNPANQLSFLEDRTISEFLEEGGDWRRAASESMRRLRPDLPVITAGQHWWSVETDRRRHPDLTALDATALRRFVDHKRPTGLEELQACVVAWLLANDAVSVIEGALFREAMARVDTSGLTARARRTEGALLQVTVEGGWRLSELGRSVVQALPGTEDGT